MSAPVNLGPLELGLAALLVLGSAGASLVLGLGLGKRLVVAGVRASLQLALLGLLLRWVFSIEGPWLVVACMLVMGLVAGREAVRRTTHSVPGQLRMSVGVMLWSSMAVSLYGLIVVLRVDPWYTPQYAIPLLGLVLGNTLNGIALGLETAVSGFVLERDQVELLLAHGATRREAARAVVRRAIRTGMIPIMNSMVAAGIVSIPGMMTGQILSGADPSSAARYQILVLFIIAGGVALGTIGAVLGATRLVFDDRDRLRLDRIRS
ncbi:MAG: putative ABC transport system permease protein [Chlamydiales bacterium]|jgi:putative ABC transport system permease protein